MMSLGSSQFARLRPSSRLLNYWPTPLPRRNLQIHQHQHQQLITKSLPASPLDPFFFQQRRNYVASMAAIAAQTFSVTVNHSIQPMAVPEDYSKKPHHLRNGKGFDNPWPSWHAPSVWKVLSGMVLSRWYNGNTAGPSTKDCKLTVRKPIYLESRHVDTTNLRATWLGHACYYVEFPEGLRVLFDPVFTQRCSPVQFMGPKRYTEAPGKISDLPIIDAVVISHNHYDHLDLTTIKQIHTLHPSVYFFVPLGNKAWFDSINIPNCIELDWFESRTITLTPTSTDPDSKTVSGLTPSNSPISATIEFLPSQHTSNRGLFDRAATLWGSWSVTTATKSVYFAGDTGYRAVPTPPDHKKMDNDYAHPEYANLPVCPVFKTIGETRGPFDLGLIPIGAYNPRWVMSPMHADPRDAARIFIDTKCKKALGMHWGTWVLTDEDVMEPPVLLRTALKELGIEETGVFDTIDIGESREY